MELNTVTTKEIRFSKENVQRLEEALVEFKTTGEEQVIEFVEYKDDKPDKKKTFIVVLENGLFSEEQDKFEEDDEE